MEILGELLHCMDVGAHGVWRIVTTLKFIQHQLAKMVHRNLLVTHKLHLHHAKEHPRCSVRRVSGFVQTRLWKLAGHSKPQTKSVAAEFHSLQISHSVTLT